MREMEKVRGSHCHRFRRCSNGVPSVDRSSRWKTSNVPDGILFFKIAAVASSLHFIYIGAVCQDIRIILLSTTRLLRLRRNLGMEIEF